MENWKKSLEVRIQELEREIACGPDGTLVYHNSGGKCRYYVQSCSKGRRTRTYLKEEDYDLKSQLLKKKLRMILLRDYKNELRAIEPYLRERKDAQLTAVFGSAAMYDLLMEICDEWQKADYAKNPYHPEALTIEGANGVLVASKSERDITFGLKDAELANRYEQKMRLGDRDVYPELRFLIRLMVELSFGNTLGRWMMRIMHEILMPKLTDTRSMGIFPMTI